MKFAKTHERIHDGSAIVTRPKESLLPRSGTVPVVEPCRFISIPSFSISGVLSRHLSARIRYLALL
ncbi:uncharacterized protein J3R85_008174 [Psidium guajava]|nr:uncharacterized protein J3R85_008174 [Psidium guajava]